MKERDSFMGSDEWVEPANGLTEAEITKLQQHFKRIRASLDVVKNSTDSEAVLMALRKTVKSIDYIMAYDEEVLNQVGISKAKLPALRKTVIQNYSLFHVANSSLESIYYYLFEI